MTSTLNLSVAAILLSRKSCSHEQLTPQTALVAQHTVELSVTPTAKFIPALAAQATDGVATQRRTVEPAASPVVLHPLRRQIPLHLGLMAVAARLLAVLLVTLTVLMELLLIVRILRENDRSLWCRLPERMHKPIWWNWANSIEDRLSNLLLLIPGTHPRQTNHCPRHWSNYNRWNLRCRKWQYCLR